MRLPLPCEARATLGEQGGRPIIKEFLYDIVGEGEIIVVFQHVMPAKIRPPF